MAKLKRVKKLEPIFSHKVDSEVKGVINIYTFDTDYANYFVTTFTQDGPHDEEIYACKSFKDAKELVEYATTTNEHNPFKALLDDKNAMLRLQQVVDYVVNGEWW